MPDAITTKPGKKYASLKRPKVYEALRRRGYSKQQAARISNAQARTKACMTCVLASLKGEQIAPGVTRIRGNLCNVHGRYGRCPGSSAAPAKPKKGRKPRAPRAPRQTPEQRAQERQAEQQQNRARVLPQLGIPEDAAGALDDLRAGKPVDDDSGLVKMGLAEQADDDSYRLTPAGRALVAAANSGDVGRARDVQSAARDRKNARTEREAAAAQRKLDAVNRRAEAEAKRREAAKKKPAKGGGTGSSSSSSDRQATRQQREAERQEDRKKREEERQADRAKREAERQEDRARREEERQEGRRRRAQERQDDRPAARIPRRRVPIQLPRRGNRGVRRKAIALKSLRVVESGGYTIQGNATAPEAYAHALTYGEISEQWADRLLRQGYIERRPDGSYVALEPGEVVARHPDLQAKLDDIRARNRPGLKSFAVFKDSAGAYRWIARTTTAFEDRDDEVISTKALETSAASPAARGPLRWWHLGKPDPLDAARPWGPGVDLGWCDFAAVSGRTLIESGTFKSEALARAVASHADALELSPGFFHAVGEPDASGVFDHIRIFERSLVPKWAGRASNRYTGLVVEKTMDQKKIQALKELGASDEVITALLAEVQQTEKSAEAEGVRYKDARPVVDFFSRLLRGETVTTKEEEPEPEPELAQAEPEQPAEPAPDPIAELMATVKALQAEVAALKAGPPVEEAKAEGDMMMAEEEMPPEEPMMEEEAEGGLTLSQDDLQAIGQVIAATLEPLIGAMGITQKLEGQFGELKSLLGGYAKTKDDERAALTARLDQTEARLADLAGDTPRQAGYRATQAPDNTLAALVGAATLKDGATPDADNPFADLVAHFAAAQR